MSLMKFYCVLVLFFFSNFCIGQKLDTNIVICGNIKTNDNGFAKFKLKLQDQENNVKIHTYSDSLKNFILIVPRVYLEGKIFTLVAEALPDEKKQILRPTYCGIDYNRTQYLNGWKKIEILGQDSINFFKCDFIVSKICHEMRFPSVEFKMDDISLLPQDSYGDYSDSVVRCLAELLQNYPKFVIEISAHADTRENDPDLIASFRGTMLKNMLVCFDINPKRLVVKSYGCRRLLITEAEIKKLPSDDEKCFARQKNRRVVFSVLRKDFEE